MSLYDDIISYGNQKNTNKKEKKQQNTTTQKQNSMYEQIVSGNFETPKITKKANEQELAKKEIQSMVDSWANKQKKRNVFQKATDAAGNAIGDFANYVSSGNAEKDAKNVAKEAIKLAIDPNERKKVAKKALVSGAVGSAQMAKGAVKTLENWYDTLQQADTYVNSGLQRKLGIIDEDEYERIKERTAKDVAYDFTGNTWKKLGWNEDNDRVLRENSYITENNLGGQFLETVGQQVPGLILGETGMNYMTGGSGYAGMLGSLKDAKGLAKVPTAAKNLGTAALFNSASNAEMAIRSYGAATEQAINEGATLDQARRYGILSALNETVTEWMTGGIPGLENSTGLLSKWYDKVVDKATGGIKNEARQKITQALLHWGGEAFGEGLEELTSDIIDPFLKNATYTEDERVDLQNAFRSFLFGMASGAFLGGGQQIASSVNNRAQLRNQQRQDMLNGMTQQTIPTMQQIWQQRQMQQQNQQMFNQSIDNQVNQIEQAVATQQMTPQEGQQALAILQNQNNGVQPTVTSVQQQTPIVEQGNTPTINETTQDNINTQEQQNVAQNANNEVEEKQDYEGLNQKEYNEIQRRYKDLMETTGFEEDLVENATPSEIVSQLKNIKELAYEGDGFLEQARMEGPEVYRQTKSEYDKINRLINRFENKIGQQTQQDNIAKQSEAFNLGKNEDKLPTDTNDKIQNFRNSVANENIKDADGFYKAVEKIIKDKDYNVIMDSSITNQNGDQVDALISNENGITVRINPKSDRAGEFLIMHEVSHGIETKEMRDLIMSYASKNAEFDSALKSLQRAYGTKDVTPEVVADISGQLFGNQEFINSLSTEKPGLFKRIYNKIVEVANKLTGNSKEALFVRDLKNKWEKAYRESNIESAQQNLKEGVKYSQDGKITDNKGRELNINMQNYMEDSQATDDKGQLVTVYHTVNHPVSQFNVFNPVGTPGYRFKNDFVTYFTDSKEMSGSYADQDYVEADTKRYTKVEEVEDFINKLNEITNNRDEWELVELPENNAVDELARFDFDNRFNGRYKDNPELAYKRGLITKQEFEDVTMKSKYAIQNNENDFIRFKSEDDLLRNFKNKLADKLSEIRKNPLSFDGSTRNYNEQKWQYEGYVNITKPYIIDAEERNWDRITTEIKEDAKKVIDSLTDEQKDYLSDLANESARKNAEWKYSEDYSNYLKYEDIYKKLDNTTSENLVILSMKDNVTAQDYKDMYKEFGEEGKAPDSKITVDGKEMDFADFAAEWCRLEMEEAKYGKNYSYFMSKAMKKYGDQLRTVGVEDMYKTAKYDFADWATESVLSRDLTTNDVVKKVLQMNKDGDDYDGVIIKNTTDYGGYSENDGPHDLYIIFSPEQFKAWNNPDPTNDPDIRYSQKAKEWQDFLEKNYKNTGTTTKLNEKIGAETKQTEVPQIPKQQRETKAAEAKQERVTKTEPVVKVDLTGEKGKEYFMENGADEKVAQILSEKPKQKSNKLETAKDAAGQTYRLLVSKGGEIERISKITNRPDVKYKYDKSMRANSEAQQHIGVEQTDLNYKPYKNFTNANGEKVSMSLNDIRNDAKKSNISEQTLNEYLAHNLNVDRYMEDKPVFGKNVTSDDSLNRIAEIEKENPGIKRIAQNVWTYEHNELKNAYDSGLISKELYDKLAKNEHYVRIQRNVDKKGSNAAILGRDGKVSVNQGIQEAKGGNQDILPIMEGIAKYTTEMVRNERINESVKSLAESMSMGSQDDTIQSIEDEESFGFNPEIFKANDDGTYTMTFFDKGKATVVPINKAIYDAYVTNKNISAAENALPTRALTYLPKKASSMFRTLTTDKNPMFMVTNFFKDIGDAPFNSKYTKEFAKEFATTNAHKQVVTNGGYNKLYNRAGGDSDSYFTEGEFKDKSQSKIGKAKDKLLFPIEKGNQIIEAGPRMAEFIATIKANGYEVNSDGEMVLKDSTKANGRSANSVLDEALYNAAEITTNFKRGGDLAKAINRNGGTFFNASIQGFDKQVRNFKDAFTSGDKKKIIALLTKALIFGVAPTMLNDAMNDDDDEYKNMQDYLKDNYYLFKTGDGNYIRIPKGRAMSVIGSAYRRTKDLASGEKDAFKGYAKFASGQVAPNNPFENNIIAPFIAVANNESWSGTKIVSQSMEKRPTDEQYNEKTDKFSIWLGQKLKNAPIPKRFKSPMGINYLIDQYTGGAGDVVLPMITPKATSKSSNPLVQPFISKFTTDSVYQQKSVGNFYDAMNNAETKKYSVKATKEDKVKYSYLYSQNQKMAELYKEQRAIQADETLSKKEKYEQAREIQKEINKLADESVKNSNNIKDYKYYATIGGNTYYLTTDDDGNDVWAKDSYADTHKKSADKKGMALYDYYKEKYEKRKAKEK